MSIFFKRYRKLVELFQTDPWEKLLIVMTFQLTVSGQNINLCGTFLIGYLMENRNYSNSEAQCNATMTVGYQ